MRQVIALSDGLRALARSGSLQVVVSDRFVRHAAETGRSVREYAPANGTSIQCTVAADDDLLVARLAADLSSAPRVDLSWCDLQGVERQRMIDIPVRAEAGDVICQQSITWGKASPTMSMTARLLAVDETGAEQVLGEYTFHHTRTIPGPPGFELPETLLSGFSHSLMFARTLSFGCGRQSAALLLLPAAGDFFYQQLATTDDNRFETPAAVRAGFNVLAEARAHARR